MICPGGQSIAFEAKYAFGNYGHGGFLRSTTWHAIVLWALLAPFATAKVRAIRDFYRSIVFF